MASLNQIWNKLLEQGVEIGDIKADVREVKTKLEGNGFAGTVARVEGDIKRVWKWVGTHPRVCPVVARKGRELARTTLVLAGVVAVFQGFEYLGKWRGWW
ncbi:hypothetical protein LCGC14_2398600 [marine sediment metagenome]|uniref:Uncharacterized protein n=1 Tax=marine sediment metagenome TaxID=412755 RepID=A0A0F9BW28_9ZZZZ